MKAVVYQGDEKIEVLDVEKPKLLMPGDAIIRVTTAAICGSDLHILHRMPPYFVDPGTIIGHEFVGVVDEVGSAVTSVKPGDRVLSPGGVNCGHCPACRSNLVWACQNGGIFGHGALGGDLPGAQAEFIRVKFADVGLIKIPDSLEDEQVIFVGDILSTGYQAITGCRPSDHGLIKPGDTVAIFGVGPVGLCAVATAKVYGASKVIAVDSSASRLEAAKKLGADMLVDFTKEDAVEAVLQATDGLGVHLAVEAAGFDVAFNNCLKAVRPAGCVSVASIIGTPVQINFAEIVAKNITIQAGICNVIHMKEILALIESGKMDLRPIITHTLPLSEAERAYEIFEKRIDGAIKVLLKP